MEKFNISRPILNDITSEFDTAALSGTSVCAVCQPAFVFFQRQPSLNLVRMKAMLN